MKQDLLTEACLVAALGETAPLFRLCVMPNCDSTNAEAKRRLAAGESKPMLLVAEAQTAGSGRMGRSFYSPPGRGIYLSFLIPMGERFTLSPTVTCQASVAVMRAIRQTIGIQTEIKWVNDLLYCGKKVCGILAESVIGPSGCGLILGIGINLRPAEFPLELAEIAGSLEDESVDRCDLIAALTRELLPFLMGEPSNDWLSDYRRHSCVLGKRIRWTRGEESGEGIAETIDSDGGLMIRNAAGECLRLCSGEISLRIRN